MLTKTVPTFGTTTYTYDITSGVTAGYVAERSVSGSRTTTKTYNKVGALYTVQDGSDVTTYAYYPNGNLQTQTMPGNITANYTYYKNNKLKTLQNKSGATTLEAYSYAYDGAGNLTAKVDVKGTTAYAYTARSELKTVTEPGGKVTAYTYDGAGNRLSETVTLSGQTTRTDYTVDKLNRLANQRGRGKQGDGSLHRRAHCPACHSRRPWELRRSPRRSTHTTRETRW